MAIKFDITGDNSQFLEAMKRVQDSVRNTSKVMTDAFDKQASVVINLTNQMNALADEIERAEKAGDAKSVEEKRKAYEALTVELKEAKEEFVSMQQSMTGGGGMDTMGNSSQSLRARLKELTMQIAELTLEYRNMSASEKNSAAGIELQHKIEQLTNDAATLRDAMGDVNDAINNVASDTNNWDALAGGINLATSAIGGFTGVASMLGVEEEKLQAIQTQLQASLAISNALTVIQTNLQQQSALMLGVRRVQEAAAAKAITIRNAAEGKGVIVTKAATIAQRAFNLVAKANPYVLLATALITVVGAFALFAKGAREATDEERRQAEETEHLRARHQEMSSSIGKSVGDVLAKYRAMQVEWSMLKNEHEKAEWVKRNSNMFNQLGLSVNSVVAAEDVLVRMAPRVVAALKAVAEAQALGELYKESIKKRENAARGTDLSNEDRIKYGTGYYSVKAGDTPTLDDLWGANLFEGDYIKNKNFFYEEVKLTESGAKKVNDFRIEVAKKRRSEYLKTFDDDIAYFEDAWTKAEQNAAAQLKGIEGYTVDKNGNVGTKPIPRIGGSGKGGGGGSSWDANKAKAETENLIVEWKEGLQKIAQEVEDNFQNAYISNIENETDKAIRELNQQESEQLNAIKEKRKSLISSAKDYDLNLWRNSAKGRDESNYIKKTDEEYEAMVERDAPGLLKRFDAQGAEIRKHYQQLREKTLRDEASEQAAAMREFLKEYGTYEQQRLAITEEYERKIVEARDANKSPYEIAAIQMQRDKQLEELGSTSFDVNWGGVFASFEGHTKEYLEGLRDQLQGILDGGNLPIDQMAVIQEKLREINAAISEQSTLFDYIGEKTREHNRLLQEAQDAQDELAKARKEEAAAAGNLITVRLGKEQGRNTKEDVIKAEAKLNEARKRTAAATRKAAQAEDAAAERSADEIARKFADAAEWVNNYLGDLPELLSNLGLGNASEKAKMGINAVNDAAGAAADFASGNYVGAAVKALSAANNIGGVLGVGGLSDKTLAEDTRKLTETNKELIKAVKELSKDIKEASPAEAIEIYNKQVEFLNKNANNTRELMLRTGAQHNTGTWGTGIGGKHSSNYRIDKGITGEEWEMISTIAKTSVTRASEFWNLTQEQMHDIAKYAPTVWAHLKDLADEGAANVAQYMDAYADSWDSINEATDALRKKLTSTTFDNVYSSFASMLSDMDSDAHTFSENFEKYMFDALLNQELDNSFRERLKAWYESFATMAEDGLTQSEIDRLRTDYMGLSAEGRRLRDELSAVTGYGSSGEGSATYNAAKSFTQEQGDILNGRLTAIQINTATGNALRQQIVSSLAQMNGIVTSNVTALDDMRTLVALSNTHLEDIVSLNKRMLNDFSEKIDKIVVNTNNL